MIEALIQAAQTEVENHSIYVWGASGQLCCEVSEAWIRGKEKGRQSDKAVEEWEAVMASPYREVARCFDCSGYVSWCLIKCGASERRRDCDGLFARSTEIYTPEDGPGRADCFSTLQKNKQTHPAVLGWLLVMTSIPAHAGAECKEAV